MTTDDGTLTPNPEFTGAEAVRLHWKNAVDVMVADVLKDSKTLREKIAAELEKKLRAQLAAALKNAA